MDATTKKMVARNQRLLGRNIAKLKRLAQNYAAKDLCRLAGTAYTDVADLMAVANAVKTGDFSAACRLISDLETEPREQVPSELYRWLFQNS